MTQDDPTSLKLHVYRQGAAAVVEIHGTADLAQAAELYRRLEELVAQSVPVIVLDLGDMNFICSMALGAIVNAHLKSRPHNGQIRLVSPRGNIRDLLETTGLGQLFPLFSSVDEAIAT